MQHAPAQSAPIPSHLRVACGEVVGELCLAHADPRNGKICCDGVDYTPTEFERLGGRGQTKKWKQSIRLADSQAGTTLGEWLAANGLDIKANLLSVVTGNPANHVNNTTSQPQVDAPPPVAAPPNPGPAVQLSLVLKVTFAHGPNNGPHPTIDYDTEVVTTPQEREKTLEELATFLSGQSAHLPLRILPGGPDMLRVCGQTLDLRELYRQVRAQGGYEAVAKEQVKGWAAVAASMGLSPQPDYDTSLGGEELLARQLCAVYEQVLLRFERQEQLLADLGGPAPPATHLPAASLSGLEPAGSDCSNDCTKEAPGAAGAEQQQQGPQQQQQQQGSSIALAGGQNPVILTRRSASRRGQKAQQEEGSDCPGVPGPGAAGSVRASGGRAKRGSKGQATMGEPAAVGGGAVGAVGGAALPPVTQRPKRGAGKAAAAAAAAAVGEVQVGGATKRRRRGSGPDLTPPLYPPVPGMLTPYSGPAAAQQLVDGLEMSDLDLQATLEPLAQQEAQALALLETGTQGGIRLPQGLPTLSSLGPEQVLQMQQQLAAQQQAWQQLYQQQLQAAMQQQGPASVMAATQQAMYELQQQQQRQQHMSRQDPRYPK